MDKVVTESYWLPCPLPVVPPLAKSLRLQVMLHLRIAMGESRFIARELPAAADVALGRACTKPDVASASPVDILD